jgi:hypothetical protein
VTGAKEWYAVVFTGRQAQAPESKKAAALLCVTVTASNEGKSERKGSHEASLWSSVCVCVLTLFTNGAQSRPCAHATAELLFTTSQSKGSEQAIVSVLELLLRPGRARLAI